MIPSSSSSAESISSMPSSSSSSPSSFSTKWWWVPRTTAGWIEVLDLERYARLVGLCGGGGRILAPFKFLVFVSFLASYFLGNHSMISSTLYAVLFCTNCIQMGFEDYKELQDEKRIENKQDDDTKNIPYIQLDRIDSDYAFALALQEQETALTSFTMSESDSSENDDGDDEDGDDDYSGNLDEDGDEIFGAELEDIDLDEEDRDTDEEIEEDDIDPDELSYEDLIALGEIVGSENNGLSIDEIKSYLCPYPYKAHEEYRYCVDQCVICQTEYQEEEPVETLPCDHTFHWECISKWLLIKKVCPICNSEVNSVALLKKHLPNSSFPPPC